MIDYAKLLIFMHFILLILVFFLYSCIILTVLTLLINIRMTFNQKLIFACVNCICNIFLNKLIDHTMQLYSNAETIIAFVPVHFNLNVECFNYFLNCKNFLIIRKINYIPAKCPWYAENNSQASTDHNKIYPVIKRRLKKKAVFSISEDIPGLTQL